MGKWPAHIQVHIKVHLNPFIAYVPYIVINSLRSQIQGQEVNKRPCAWDAQWCLYVKKVCVFGSIVPGLTKNPIGAPQFVN